MRGVAVSLFIASLLSVPFLTLIALADSGAAISDPAANPDIFNSTRSTTAIEYGLGNVTDGTVWLEIYDADDNLVRTIDGGTQSTGQHQIMWDGNSDGGLSVPEGTYSARINVSAGGGDAYQPVQRWGGTGSGSGQLNYPTDIAFDSVGNIYVTEYNNKRVQKFDPDGTSLAVWGISGNPHGIAIDRNDNVYVADQSGRKVHKFDSNGALLTSWDLSGNPHGIAVDSNGNVYVPDFSNNQVQKFDSAGNLLTQWGSLYPFSVAVDSAGHVYVTQLWKHRIQKFDSDGRFITAWGSKGAGNGQFDEPRGVAVDSNGNVYVGDSGNDRIQKFDASGNFITAWGSEGNGEGQFQFPNGLDITSGGYIYVADSGNNRVQGFAPPSMVISAATSVTVDNTPPDITLSVSPDTLWPPNHKLVEVMAVVTVSDNYDPSPAVVLSSIESSSGSDIAPDVESAETGTEDYSFWLRAETEDDGSDRIYVITYTATDAAANSSHATVDVTVPHDLGKKTGQK